MEEGWRTVRTDVDGATTYASQKILIILVNLVKKKMPPPPTPLLPLTDICFPVRRTNRHCVCLSLIGVKKRVEAVALLYPSLSLSLFFSPRMLHALHLIGRTSGESKWD